MEKDKLNFQFAVLVISLPEFPYHISAYESGEFLVEMVLTFSK